jgi:phosphatidylserine/phosphatidylglycerophosphate/cardiolipin synthase-like enzyme
MLLLESCFRQLNSRNINTVVWTKDPSDLATRSERHKELAEQLTKLGADVLFRSGTHEKAVIIDEIISYYGSLNPLSSLNTKETMLRVKDRAFAKALIDHLKIGEEKTEQQDEHRKTRQSAGEGVSERLGLKKIEGKIDLEKARKLFKKLRWIIAEDKGLPVQATLWGRTIDWLIEFRPKDLAQLFSCEEFRRNKTNIAGYEEIVLQIVDLIVR